MTIRTGTINAARVLKALGRIGYHPVSALLDIVDNSVSANATTVTVKIETEQQKVEGRGRKKATVKSFTFFDNGKGMDESGLENALSLGSSEDYYTEGTLSKFGLGLKSASSSLGNRLEIISRMAGGTAMIASLDQSQLGLQYEYNIEAASPEDVALLDGFCGENASGTIVRITDIHLECMPPVAEIIDRFQSRAGVIFYYYLTGIEPASHRIALKLNDEEITPVDPLFIDRINEENGDLDEYTWDGIEAKWINRPQKIALDDQAKSFAVIEITQLPHPPSVAFKGEMTQAECRREYMIGAGNYGFYIYRNGRLISWADSLGGQVQLDQDLFSFRGRILITDDADDILNLDVTKSRIHLSEVSMDQIYPLLQEAKKKSIQAWKTASTELTRITERDPHSEIVSELSKLGELDEKEDIIDEDASPVTEKEKLKGRREIATKSKPVTEEEGRKLVENDQRVQYVPFLENGQLWERAHHPSQGLIVRVNESHPLNRDIISVQSGNVELIKLVDILFYALARGEYEVIYKSDYDPKEIESIMDEYRERVGSSLSEIMRRLKKAAS